VQDVNDASHVLAMILTEQRREPEEMANVRVMTMAVLAMVVIGGGAACAGGQDDVPAGREVAMAPHSMLHPMVQAAPPTVQEAYRFAVANADVLQYVPCYCGCGRMGHTSVRSCYVKEDRPDGSVTFDDHALGCGICVDIARDAMRMLREGKDLRQIQDAVRKNYGRYGRPTPIIAL